jgi:hypothetical protein
MKKIWKWLCWFVKTCWRDYFELGAYLELPFEPWE